MSATLMGIRIDKDLKNDFENVCQDLGMNPTVAINIFIRAVVRDKKIPFEVKTYSSKSYTNASENSDNEDSEDTE